MLMTRGTINGFRYGDAYIGRKEPPPAVVPRYANTYYATSYSAAKRMAKQQGAFGIWRLKRKG